MPWSCSDAREVASLAVDIAGLMPSANYLPIDVTSSNQQTSSALTAVSFHGRHGDIADPQLTFEWHLHLLRLDQCFGEIGSLHFVNGHKTAVPVKPLEPVFYHLFNQDNP